MPKKTSKKSARGGKAARAAAPARKAPAARGRTKKAAARRPAAAAAARKSKRVQAIPQMYGPVTPQLVVSPCGEALDFYERAFGAKVLGRMPGPDGLLMHAEMNIGGSVIMLSDQFDMPGPVRKSPRNAGATTGGVMLYVKDVDAAFERAVAAGATAVKPPADEFWGDRFGQVEDPYGHVWAMATHVRDVSPAEMQAAMSSMAPPEA